MGDEASAILLGHVGDAALFTDPTNFGHVRLDDIEGTGAQPGEEGLATGQYLATGDGQGSSAAEELVLIERIGMERLFKPIHAIACEHIGGPEGPLVAVAPVGIASARIDHELAIGADGVARGTDDRLIHGTTLTPKGSPTDLEGAEAPLHLEQQILGHLLRCAHEKRCVGFDPFAVAPTQEPTDRLASRLTENIPEGDIDPTDRMGHRATTPLPEGVLVQQLTHTHRLQGILVLVEGFEEAERSVHQVIAGKDTPNTREPLVRPYDDEGMNTIVWGQFAAPTTLRSGTTEAKSLY